MKASGSSPEEAGLPGIDRLIHEPARLSIMANLFVVESADFVFLLNRTGLTNGNLSSHMSRLEGAGYVEEKKEFVDRKPRTMYRLTKEGRKAFDDYRRAMLAAMGDPGAGLSPQSR